MDRAVSPRRGMPDAQSQMSIKGHKTTSKKKMKDTIKVMFKTEKRKKDKSRLNVPKNVKLLRDYLERNSLRMEGIMRVSGNQNEVKKLKNLLDSGEPVDLSTYTDHNIIAGAFKMMFREMPEPLLTFDLYKNFLGAHDLKDSHARLSFLKALLITLPPFNSELFMELIQFLYNIQLHSSVNRMTSDNLAIVFAPTVLRPREETVDTMMGDAAASASVVQFMIDNCKTLYPDTQVALPIISTISSEDAKEKKQEKSLDKMFEESLDKLNNALQSQADEARERAVWESYAQSLQNKLEESDDSLKVMKEERDSLLDVIKDIKQSRTALEEQVAQLQQKVESIPKLQEEVATLRAERDTAIDEKIKHISQLGATNSDSQKQSREGMPEKSETRKKLDVHDREYGIAALQEEFAKVTKSHELEKKSLQDQIQKFTKEKKESEDKFAREIKSLKDEIKRTEEASAQQLSELGKLREKEKQAGVREQELSKQVEGLRAQHKQAIQDLDAKSQEVVQLKRERTDVDAKLKTQTNEVATLKKKLETEGAAKAADLQKQIGSLQTQNAELQKQVSELKGNVDDKQRQIDEKQKQIEEKQRQINEERTHTEDKQKIINEMQRQAESLKSDNTRLQSQKPGGAPVKGNAEADSLRQQLEKEKRSHQDQLDKEKKSHQDQLDKEKKSHQDQLDKEKKSHQDALNKEKKAQQELKKELESKSDELDKLKKQAKASGKGWTAASPTAPPTPPSSPPTPSLDQTVEDLKHHLFTWLTLALKFDRMAMRKLCNINSSVLYEKITDQKIHYADWPDFIRAEMDKCTIDM